MMRRACWMRSGPGIEMSLEDWQAKYGGSSGPGLAVSGNGKRSRPHTQDVGIITRETDRDGRDWQAKRAVDSTLR